MQLCVRAERYLVTENPFWESKLATLNLTEGLSIVVTPLTEVGVTGPLLEDDFEEEISKGEVCLPFGECCCCGQGTKWHIPRGQLSSFDQRQARCSKQMSQKSEYYTP
jgi:hypothetical protein